MHDTIAARFHEHMLAGYHTLAKLGYRPTYFLKMIQEYGGVEAAKRLLQSENPSAGLTTLWQLGRLDLSVEAFVLQPAYRELFTADEHARARQRLTELNYSAPWDSSDGTP